MSETIPHNGLADNLVDALRALRNGDFLTLADSPLAYLSITQDVQLLHEPATLETHARWVSALLHWAIAQLRPSGIQNWHNSLWRHYNVLSTYYIEGQRVSDVAEALGIADQTFYEWRTAAVDALAWLIARENAIPSQRAARLALAVRLQYDGLTREARQVLRLLSLIDSAETLPLTVLTTLLPMAESVLPELAAQHLIQRDKQTVAIQPAVAESIQALVKGSDWRDWQWRLARHFQAEKRIAAAAIHLMAAGATKQAADWLLEHQQYFFTNNEVGVLDKLLKGFGSADAALSSDLWAQLNLLKGRVARLHDDLPSALDAFGAALSAHDLLTKAHAYHQRALILQKLNLDECLSHYGVCIDLLERGSVEGELQTLLARMYIDRAWIFIQERPDWERGSADLQRAEQYAPPLDSTLWCDLYNAWAGLVSRQRDQQAALEYRQKAWLTAYESKRPFLMAKTAYNLGQAYLMSGNNAEGMRHLQKAQKMAETAGDQQMIAVTYKGLGAGYFFQDEFAAALTQYEHAYAIWQETKNQNWLANICFDLTEAHAISGDFANARRYLKEGRQLVAALGHERLRQEFAKLVERFPALEIEVNPRQAQALHHVREHDAITRQQFVNLTLQSKSQAYRDLEELCTLGLLQRVGKGRGTRYITNGDHLIE